ncbi:hypothetical protein, partial [Gallibacterium anatis]|uniref:hypothetical protein n=1 Tax=Gallibacterium anatis TaxID=750 RepID=UPI0030059431
DLNQRPSGYEPDELPSCSTPRPKYVAYYTYIFCLGKGFVEVFAVASLGFAQRAILFFCGKFGFRPKGRPTFLCLCKAK